MHTYIHTYTRTYIKLRNEAQRKCHELESLNKNCNNCYAYLVRNNQKAYETFFYIKYGNNRYAYLQKIVKIVKQTNQETHETFFRIQIRDKFPDLFIKPRSRSRSRSRSTSLCRAWSQQRSRSWLWSRSWSRSRSWSWLSLRTGKPVCSIIYVCIHNVYTHIYIHIFSYENT